MCCDCQVKKSLCGCSLKTGCLIISSVFLVIYIIFLVLYCVYSIPIQVYQLQNTWMIIINLILIFFVPLLMPTLLLYGTLKRRPGCVLASLVLLWHKILVLALITLVMIIGLSLFSYQRSLYDAQTQNYAYSITTNARVILTHFQTIFIIAVCIGICILGNIHDKRKEIKIE